jgi:alkanesulfonate monooxygenase SsuD/methylene tetrahydromethanopterin reductase-like flavin-dependent oxidoreductase (luciferase family)
VAGATTRIRIGSAIAWALGLTPITLATDVRSLAELAPGRVRIGLGTGNPSVIAQWHGIDEARPAARLAELVPLLRRIWELGSAPVDHEGEFYRCRIPVDPMLPPWPDAPGLERRPPILLAGGREPMIRAAGLVADGLIGLPICSPAFLDEVIRPILRDTAEQAGRPEPVPVTGMIICAVGAHPERARALAATQVAVFATRPSAAPLMAFHGFEAEIAAISEAFARRDLPAVADAVSDRMLDTLAVYGTPEEAWERFSRNFDGVYDEPLLFTAGKGMPEGGFEESLFGACEAFGD